MRVVRSRHGSSLSQSNASRTNFLFTALSPRFRPCSLFHKRSRERAARRRANADPGRAKDLRKPDDLATEICCLAARLVSISRQLSAESAVSGRSRDALSIKTSFKGSLFDFSARRNIGLTSIYPRQSTKARFRCQSITNRDCMADGGDHPRPRGLCCARRGSIRNRTSFASRRTRSEASFIRP